MKLARDFRKSAFEALRGKWGIAVLAAVLASICGAASATSVSFNFSFDSGNDAPPQTDAGFDIDPELLVGILIFAVTFILQKFTKLSVLQLMLIAAMLGSLLGML